MGPQTPFYFGTGRRCQPRVAGMDQGIQGRLKNPAGLQVYSDLERLGEKHKTKTEKEKKTERNTSYLLGQGGLQSGDQLSLWGEPGIQRRVVLGVLTGGRVWSPGPHAHSTYYTMESHSIITWNRGVTRPRTVPEE